ncbi:Ig-like domain-containing protein [Ramlibacter terrae]|uniref:Ig-like domain-containing protein n=1 Tax=Ramlibacter terrae TaxID=2732511 RepID=A0ABX6P266_9BURK|nr:Ig-like domain-containing protein [Ramlibacter terrae]
MVTVNVGSVADIAGDTASVNEDGSVTSNLLANDSFEGAEIIKAVTQGAHGTVTIVDAAPGTVQYTADPNWSGTDSYTYTVTSGGVTETATVVVTVNPVDDAPVFSGDTSGSGNEDAGAITGTLAAVDSADGMPTPGYSVSGTAAHGTASIDASGAGPTRPPPTTTARTASPSRSPMPSATPPRR